MSQGSVRVQYFAAASVNLLTVAYGCLCAWPSSNLLVLESDQTPLASGPITREESSWINSIICIGGLIGNFVAGWMADKIGRKPSLLLMGIPQAICWIMVIFGKSVLVLCIGRLLGGFAGGGTYVLVPLYVTEIAEDRIRGLLGAYIAVACMSGVLFVFVLGNYLSYIAIPCVVLSLPILYTISVMFLPETPYYLMKKDKIEQAEKALKYLRSVEGDRISSDVKEELELLRGSEVDSKDDVDNSTITLQDFCAPVARKGLLLGTGIIALNQFSGCFAMISYTGTIFKEAGSSMSPNMSAIVVGIIALGAGYLATFFVERAGRKILLAVSAIGMAIGLCCLAAYLYLKELEYDITNFKWVPIASFSFVVFIAGMGIVNLPFVVIAEMLPPKIRSSGISICMGMMWLFAFIIIKYLPLLSELLQLYGALVLFASCCLIGGIFVIFCVPETKGKSLDMILKLLE